MPFEIVRNDITQMTVDAIVNTANPKPIVGSGTDTMIHKKAGPKLLAARQKIGSIDVGSAAITPAFDLQAKHVIHTVGPVWDGGSDGEEALLRNCYDNSLKLAREHRCRSIAFPLISTGNYGFPKDKALQIAISAFSAFLLEHDLDMTVYIVVFNKESFQLSTKLFSGVRQYIDDHYVDTTADLFRERRCRWNRPEAKQTVFPDDRRCFYNTDLDRSNLSDVLFGSTARTLHSNNPIKFCHHITKYYDCKSLND